jgi:hypothetical protein
MTHLFVLFVIYTFRSRRGQDLPHVCGTHQISPPNIDTANSSAIVDDLRPLFLQGSATLAYFYCDFRDLAKRSVRNAISSLLIQLAAQSDSRREVLQQLYASSGNGVQEPSDDSLLQCLRDTLSRPGQGTTYIVIDALDECLSSSTQPTRDAVRLIQALVTLGCNDLRIFATNHPEQDIHDALLPLSSHTYSLHETQEHIDDIVNYIKWRIQENSRMRRWRYEDRVSTWEVLSQKAAGASVTTLSDRLSCSRHDILGGNGLCASLSFYPAACLRQSKPS